MASSIGKRFKDSISLPLKFVGFLWVIEIVQFLLQTRWGYLGLFPREIFGLKGIITAPLLHSGFPHLLSNSGPLLMMGAMILFFYPRIAKKSFLLIYLLTGIAVWAFGRSVFHIGASGVAYGLVAFVFWLGIFRRNIKSIALALIVVFYYGSLIMGILPGQEGISWESHLLGALAGVFVAFLFKNSIENDETRRTYSWENKKEEPKQFLDPDTFERKKEELFDERYENW